MLTNPEDLAFNMTLEILQGCGYSCQDCAIDQSITSDFVAEGDTERLLTLADEMSAQGYRLHEFTLGPTDIISSKSGLAVLDRPLVKGLAARYSSMTVSLALLFDTDLVALAQKVDQLMAGKKFRLVVPTTLKNAGNAKFMELIRQRVQVIKDNLHQTEFKLVYLTINMINASAEKFSLSTNWVAQHVDLGVPTLVEYVFPHSRNGFDNLLNRSKFLHDFRSFTDGMKECKDTTVNRYLIPTISDSLEVTYHRGELYYTPVLMEKFPLFRESFIIERPWSADTIIDRKANQYHEALLENSEHPACGDCCFFDHCARGDTQLIMKHIEYDDCLLDMKNRWDLNPITNPVRSDD